MSQSESSESGGKSMKGLSEVIGSFVAIATLLFGVFTWWDARSSQKPEEPKVVAVNAPAPGAPGPGPFGKETAAPKEEKPAAAAPDPLSVPHPFKTMKGKLLYLYRSAPLDAVNSEIEKVVIVMPAFATQGAESFAMMRDAAQAQGRSKETLVAVPLFREKTEDLLKDEHLWLHNWDVGGASIDSSPISSFLVMDELYGVLTDPKTFPNLRSIVLIGRHAGGIFINHYIALGNPSLPPRKTGPQVDELYVMLSPGLLLYIDPYRPVLGRNGPAQFDFPKAPDCNDYNHYPTGLDARPRTLPQVSDKTIRDNLFRRHAVYMVGSRDTSQRGVIDTCGARLTGRDRFHRNRYYWEYIQTFPRWKDNVVYKEIEGATHFDDQFYKSQEVRQVVFGPSEPAQPKIAKRSRPAKPKVAER
jgi:hypothetical protein